MGACECGRRARRSELSLPDDSDLTCTRSLKRSAAPTAEAVVSDGALQTSAARRQIDFRPDLFTKLFDTSSDEATNLHKFTQP